MKFEKGKSGNPAGKPVGTVSKDTRRFKEALNNMLEYAADDMVSWLEQIEEPKQRIDILKDFAEYIYPKLARTESQTLDKDGKPTDPISKIVIEHVDVKK